MQFPKKEEECYLTKKEYSKITGALRQVFARSEFAKQCRERRVSKIKGSRGGKRYDCDNPKCNVVMTAQETELHHITEVIEIGKHYYDYTLNEIVARLWCGFKGITLLCHDCHAVITKEQNEERKRLRALAKKGKKK
jgi:hypothetical protein